MFGPSFQISYLKSQYVEEPAEFIPDRVRKFGLRMAGSAWAGWVEVVGVGGSKRRAFIITPPIDPLLGGKIGEFYFFQKKKRYF